MSHDDFLPGPDSCGADVAAYALGALEPAEAEAFERHLASCAVCPVELSAFQQVVEDIATSAPPYPAPRGLKRRVMDAVEADRELVTELESAGRRPARAPRGRWRPSLPASLLGAGAAFAVAAVVVGILLLPGRPANRTIAARVAGSGEVSLKISGGHAELVLHHVAAPPRGDIYEVWLQHGSKISPTTALFSVNRQGDGSVDVPGSLYGVSHVMVTAEPPGGTLKPTHPPVITAAL